MSNLCKTTVELLADPAGGRQLAEEVATAVAETVTVIKRVPMAGRVDPAALHGLPSSPSIHGGAVLPDAVPGQVTSVEEL